MARNGHEAVLAKLRLTMHITREEEAALNKLPIYEERAAAKSDVIKEGARPRRSCVVVEGFLATAKTTIKGRRAIAALHVPGDMPDLNSLHLNVMDFSLTALTDCRLGFINHPELMRFFDAWPRLLHGFWRGTLVEGAIYREGVVNIGHREAPIRIAHLFCELSVRNRIVSNADDLSFALPITQTELADITGLSAVHVNRALQALRGSGLITYTAGVVTIVNWEKLVRMADFNPVYLHLPTLPDGVGGITDAQWGLAR
jgi:CRP-like cAMP-binding protein